MAQKIDYSIEPLAQLLAFHRLFNEMLKKFCDEGVKDMYDFGMEKNGDETDQKVDRVHALVDVLNEKCEQLSKTMEINENDLDTIIKNLKGFSEEDLTKRVQEIVDTANPSKKEQKEAKLY